MIRAIAIALLLAPALAAAQPYDLVLKNARVVDGTGAPWYRAEVAIRGDTIVDIAPAIAAPAKRTIDVKDAVVAPGFIDIHTHAGRALFQVPTADNYIRQGVTTVLEGADGAGSVLGNTAPLPLAPFLERVEKLPRSINFAVFVGQNAVREKVLGLVDRKATPEEIDRMREIVRQAMKDGAWGLSTGLFYVPGAFTPQEEIVALQKEVAPFRGVHTSHMRDEAGGVVASVKETIAIGELGGVPTHVSHHKTIGKANWGRTSETLKLIDEARARGVDVTLDQYPYTASSTSLQAGLLPKWLLEGGLKATQDKLKDPAQRARARKEVAETIANERGGGDPANVALALCNHDASLAGKNIAQVTRERGVELTMENAAETVLILVERGGCAAVYHAIGAEDVERVMRHPATMIASDGGIIPFGQGAPHPRSYGTFARVLGVYVREKGVLPLEEAVKKMSAMPAARLGLKDRGLVKVGMKADLAVFDPKTVRDMATYEKPHQYAEGFSAVIVNGAVVYEDGVMTDARPGRVLYGPGKN